MTLALLDSDDARIRRDFGNERFDQTTTIHGDPRYECTRRTARKVRE
jgi:hypothetical protein